MISLKEFDKKIKEFADKVKKDFASIIVANPEDQLKRPVSSLIESLIQKEITTRTETQIEGLGARPDIGIARKNLLCGYIELKAPYITIKSFKGPNKLQFDKFKALPNLIYTNGTEWAHYKNGERTEFITFSEEIVEFGSKALSSIQIEQLYKTLIDFLNWEPIIPNDPKVLAEMLAPLCHLLRSDVEEATKKVDSAIYMLYKDWQRLFFPEADIHQFADAYAQTLTYALLLARLSGATLMDPENAAKYLDSGHSLLAQTLRLLGQANARIEMQTAVDLLQRIIGAINLETLRRKGDLWLYFYEDFLSVYDPKLRKDYGVYYTPIEVVECQVNLCSELLKDRFNKSLGFADNDVTFLDPATGTGTFPITAIQLGLKEAAEKYGEGILASIATRMAQNFNAFEFMVGPYAVSHMRITQLLKDAGAELPKNGIKVFLTDTLEDPESPSPRFSFAEKELAEEHLKAQNIKKNSKILVCMGNPPYDREQKEEGDIGTARRKGGWVRFGSDLSNFEQTKGILKDFIEGAPGIHVKNLYNDYVYFWRWALWKLFENKNTTHDGIISFITASSYIKGPGFVSMRRKMREAFEELWIIDLEGDNIGARKTENVFNIQTPVAIAIGYNKNKIDNQIPSKVWYSKITGTRVEKLKILSNIRSFNDIKWQTCLNDWEKPMLPITSGDYFSYPLLTDVFPWQHSGVQFKRNWPISFSERTLQLRWTSLMNVEGIERKKMFGKEGDRPINKDFKSTTRLISGGKRISLLSKETPIPSLSRYCYRSFDRQWCIPDNRLAGRIRPELWESHSDNQVYLLSILSEVLSSGTAAYCSSIVPDTNCFIGRGGKDIIPLWKDIKATQPNITQGLLAYVSDNLGIKVSAVDLFSYCYALLASPEYTRRFSEDLINPGPRVPITKDAELFSKASKFGQKLIFLHTFGERFNSADEIKGQITQGVAKCVKAIPSTPEGYPVEYNFDEYTQTLKVGDGLFRPVSKGVFDFSISGWYVLKKWLSYRMKVGSGKKSSPLDNIRQEIWTAEMTKELLELIWVLEHTNSLFPMAQEILTKIVSSNCFDENELPKPSDVEKEPIKPQGQLLL